MEEVSWKDMTFGDKLWEASVLSLVFISYICGNGCITYHWVTLCRAIQKLDDLVHVPPQSDV